MKKKIILIIICILIIIGIGIRNIENDVKSPKNSERITRAEVTRMLSFLFYSEGECDSLDRVIIYKDSNKEKWFDKYVNAICTLGLISDDVEEVNNEYRPYDYFTYGETIDILKRVEIITKENKSCKNKVLYKDLILKFSFNIEEMKKDTAIDKKKWEEIYNILIKSINILEIEEKEVFVINAADNKNDFKTVTENGVYKTAGLDLSKYQDEKIKVLVRDQSIIMVKNKVNEKTILKNVWLVKENENEITGYFSSTKHKFKIKNSLSKPVDKVIGDLTIEKKKVVKISIKPEIINGKVLATNKSYIELEEYGKLPIEKDFKIYKVYGEEMAEINDGILSGYRNTDFVVSNGKICAALVKDEVKAKNIRVLLKNNDFLSIFHQKVVITANCDYTISYGKNKKKLKKNKKINLDNKSKMLKNGRVKIKTNNENGKIYISSLKRGNGTPKYRGTIEVVSNEEGLTIINELSLEEYLYSVLPSEMSPENGKEALKAQAVCARSYAYNQLLDNKYSEYGAHVDDSVSYQVYNNQPETKTTIEAVNDTFGKVMKNENKVITAYYFSTSCGYTSNADDVWLTDNKLPYLTGKMQNINECKKTNLSNEKNFREFLKSDIKTYDSKYAWYRWNVRFSEEKLRTSIERELGNRYNANPKLILTFDKEKNKYRSIPIDTVGSIENIRVLERKNSGLVTEIEIIGSKNTVKIISEYNIRLVLAPLDVYLKRRDGSKLTNLTMLPSSFFVIDKEITKKNGTNFILSGGGYGHGVGMSQNGVETMSKLGMNYQEILKHYYEGIKIGDIY